MTEKRFCLFIIVGSKEGTHWCTDGFKVIDNSEVRGKRCQFPFSALFTDKPFSLQSHFVIDADGKLALSAIKVKPNEVSTFHI